MAESTNLQEQIEQVGERIATTSCILEIHIRQPGFKKKMNSAAFLLKSGNAADISPDVLSVSKDLIEKRDIAYLEAHRTNFLAKLKGYSVYGGGLTLGNGQYLMPLELVERIKDDIQVYGHERQGLLDRFENSYNTIKEKAKSKLGGFYDESEYPPFSQIRRRYTLDYKFISNSVPETLKRVSDRFYFEERIRINRELSQTSKEIQDTTRQVFYEFVDSLTQKLGRDEETGKVSVVPEARIKQLLEFIELFSVKNIVDDRNLASVVQKAKEALTGVSIKQIKTNQEYREALTEKFEKIKADTESLITSKTRSISL